MNIVVKKNSIETIFIFDILIGYQNRDKFDEEYKKLGLVFPTECIKVYKEVDKTKKELKELIGYYFSIESDDLDRVYSLSMIFFLNLCFYDLDFEESIEFIDNLTKDDILRSVLIITMLCDNDINYEDLKKEINSKSYIDEEIVINKIDKSKKLSHSFKWKLYKIIKDYRQSISDIIYILKEISIIRSRSYKNLLEMSYKWAAEVKHLFYDKGTQYLLYLNKNMDFSKINNLYINPVSAWRCYNFTGYKINSEEFVVDIGYNVEQTLDRFRRGKSDEWFKEVLKSLADATRYKILKLLSKKEMYSGEIAIETGMSQGTISHHMSILQLYDLVESFRQDGRVYYKLNKEKLKSWTGMLREKL